MTDKPDPTRPADELLAQAERLYPDSPYLQKAWLRAVAIVRTTARGWLLDAPVVRIRSKAP